MIFSLLDETTPEAPNNGWVSWVLIGVLVVVLIVSMILMNRRSKKREQEAQALIDAVKPGNKVKTIGGICGIVVSVDPVEDTFVLETGTEESGKSYMKFVRQAILESDAVVEPTAAKNKELPAPEGNEEFAETPAKEVESAENTAAEAPADGEAGAPAEEAAPVEEAKPDKSGKKKQG